MQAVTELTIENAQNAVLIVSKNNPEWGTKRFTFDALGYHWFGTGSDSAMLYEHEFRLWNVVKFKDAK